MHNACRSQIAEAICKRFAPDAWTISSAGINPFAQVDRKAVDILERHQLVMTSPKPQGFSALPAIRWDNVVDIQEAPEAVIYQHTDRFLRQHQYLASEPANDFAYWVTHMLQDEPLGERLAAIDTIQFHL